MEIPKKILVSGSHGLIGSSVFQYLKDRGHNVYSLVRNKNESSKHSIYIHDKAALFENFDAVIHLAGKNVGQGRWTKKRKKQFFQSRVELTANLVSILSSLKHPPKAFICASAIGYYGNRSDEILTENSPPGKELFLTTLCQQWEAATKPLSLLGTRVVNLRFGMVLSSKGGALKQMFLPYKLGLGGKIGKGDQYISWIALDDVASSIYHIICKENIQGAVNITAPNPVRNAEFSKILREKLGVFFGIPLPTCIANLLFGQKGKELLLSSLRAVPEKLLKSGYAFRFSTLTSALSSVIVD